MNTTLSLLLEHSASFQSRVAMHLFGKHVNGPSTCSLISLAAYMCKLTVAIMPMKVGTGHKQKKVSPPIAFGNFGQGGLKMAFSEIRLDRLFLV